MKTQQYVIAIILIVLNIVVFWLAALSTHYLLTEYHRQQQAKEALQKLRQWNHEHKDK